MIGISIVLYYPSEIDINNIKLLINSINSDNYILSCFINDNNIYNFDRINTISSNGVNIGLGAHNINADYLFKNGCDKIITLDQDTVITKYEIDQLESVLNSLPNNTIIGPKFIDRNGAFLNNQYYDLFNKISKLNNLIETNFVITSGMMLSMSWWNTLGGYYSDLFIGDLDVEFCKRSKTLNGGIYQVTTVNLLHNVGLKRIGYPFITIVKHNPRRYYFNIRNKIKLILEGRYNKYEIFPLSLYFFFIVLTLPKNSNKLQVFKYCILGLRDGIKKIGGPVD